MFALIPLAPLFRILMLATLMAGVVMKPVLAFAGDMHEGGHAVLAVDDGHADDHDGPNPIDPSDADDPLHALIHFGHCCGQTPALLPPVQLGSIVPAVTESPLPWPVTIEASAHPVDLRPPITI